ncbi:MAG: tetratricopeptide repeat protein [bacterium]|nr:tetratricopeptide repeat protein [bacterium]
MQGLRFPNRIIIIPLLTLIFIIQFNGKVYGQEQSYDQRLRQARTLANQGFHARAVEMYRQLYKEQPQNNAMYVQYSQLLDRMRLFDELLSIIDTRIQTRKNNINLLGEKARILYRSGKENDARAVWEEVIQLSPDDPATYSLVSQFQQVVRLTDDAIETLLRGREQLNNLTAFSYALGNLYMQRRNYRMAATEYLISVEKDERFYAAAERMINTFPPDSDIVADVTTKLETFIGNNPDNVRIKRLLSGFFIKNKEYEKAFLSYNDLDKLTNSPGNNILGYSDQLSRMGIHQYAILGYSNFLEKYPDSQYSARAEFGLARSYEESGFESSASEDLPDSVHTYYRTRAADTYGQIITGHAGTPWVLESYYRLGEISFNHLFDLDGAINSYQNVRVISPNSNIAWDAALKIGDCYRAKGDLEGSDNFYKLLEKAAVKLQDLKYEARLRLIHNEFYKNKFGNAVQKANELYNEIPKNNDLSNDLLDLIMFFEDNSWRDHEVLKEYAAADLFVIMRKNTEAENTLEDLFNSLEDHDLKDDILFKLASIKRELLKFDESIGTFEKLISDYPGSIYIERAHFEKGKVYESDLKNTERAKEIYEAFLIAYPESIYLNEVRKRLRKLQSSR